MLNCTSTRLLQPQKPAPPAGSPWRACSTFAAGRARQALAGFAASMACAGCVVAYRWRAKGAGQWPNSSAQHAAFIVCKGPCLHAPATTISAIGLQQRPRPNRSSGGHTPQNMSRLQAGTPLAPGSVWAKAK